MLKNMNNVKKYNLIENPNTNRAFQKGLYSKKEYNSCIVDIEIYPQSEHIIL